MEGGLACCAEYSGIDGFLGGLVVLVGMGTPEGCFAFSTYGF
jgi:hypothetical protein